MTGTATRWIVSGQALHPYAAGEPRAREFRRWLDLLAAQKEAEGASDNLPPSFEVLLPAECSPTLAETLTVDAIMAKPVPLDESVDPDLDWAEAARAACVRRDAAGLIEMAGADLRLRCPRRPSPGRLVVGFPGFDVPADDDPAQQAFLRRLEAMALHADVVVVESKVAGDWVRARFDGWGLRGVEVRVIPPAALDLDGQEDGGRKRIFLGLSRRTTAALLRDALATLGKFAWPGGVPEIVLVGSGVDGDQRRWEALVRQSGWAGPVERGGWPSREGLASLFRSALAFGPLEPMGTWSAAVVDGLMAGVAIIAPEGSEAAELAGPATLSHMDGADGLSSAVWDRLASAGPQRAGSFRGNAVAGAWWSLLRSLSDDTATAGAPAFLSRAADDPFGLVWYTPLPPSPGGVSRYSADFIRALSSQVPVEVRWSDAEPDADLGAAVAIRPASGAPPPTVGQLPVYNIQNNLEQGTPAYEAMIRHPGLAILHDLNIHPFLLERHRRQMAAEGRGLRRALTGAADAANYEYFRALQAAHGPEGESEAWNMLVGGLLPDLHARPCNRIVTASCPAVVVHGQWGAAQLRRNGDPACVESIPLGIEHPLLVDSAVVADLRARCGIRPGDFTVVCAGIMGPQRRLEKVLFAMTQAEARGVAGRLVLSGPVDGPVADYVRNEAARFGYSDRVTVLGQVSDPEFAAAMHLADCVVHLNYPTLGQTSSTVLRALSAGKPVIVSDCDSFSDLPDDVAWKVPPNHAEVPVLVEYFSALGRRPNLRAEMGRRAIAHIQAHHTWEKVAARFLQIVERRWQWLRPRRPAYSNP